MDNSSSRHFNARRMGILLICSIFALLTLISIHRFGQAAMSGHALKKSDLNLINITIAGLGLLSIITFWQILRSARIHQRKRKSSLGFFYGWRIFTTAIIPAAIIAAFSWQYLTYDLGKVFNTRINNVLDSALQLTRTAISIRTGQALEQTRILRQAMSDMNQATLITNIEPLRRQTGALELAVFDLQGTMVAFSSIDPSKLIIDAPSTAAMLNASDEQEHFEYGENNGEYTIRVLTIIHKPENIFYLQAVYSMPEAFNNQAKDVREQYRQHQSYNALQPRIRANIILVFATTLLLTTLIIIWLSAHFSERLSHPLRTLSRAAGKIAGGDYHARITDLPRNELGILGNQFNQMSQSLEDAHRTNNRVQRLLTEQKVRLETVMDNITGGVLTLDGAGRLQSWNQNAGKILDTALSQQQKTSLPEAGKNSENSYQELMLALLPYITTNQENWQQEVTLNKHGARKILMCHGSRLPDSGKRGRNGHVIVIDDITEFLHAQRSAAWEEVAKRLAHEIKNPLTPIRLQSERLQKRLGDKIADPQDQQVLNKATETIIDQVEAMQQIVADFSQIAKPLETRRQNLQLNTLLKQIAELYRDQQLELDLQETLSEISGDPVQLRQVLINLMKNAIEAIQQTAEGKIRWRTRQHDGHIILDVEDNGQGFADLDKDPFEPYVTNKPKGTGLGLAIVKKIIHEHDGTISAGHSRDLGGAKITLTFPVTAQPSQP
ncbi:MAG: ATP-binding protein [Cardiobacteriaceae bacterium]|nr:ATP-binding protein [Cardiobacteriaceae bacterium]